MAGGRPALRWVGQVVAWSLILGVVAAVTVAVLVPRVAGGTPYSVLTGSMRPDYPPGTLVVVRPVAPEDVRSGDVITYQRESGSSTVVTHRVVTVSTSLTGEVTFTTQGDANDAVDPDPVRAVQVRGRLWYAVPHVGRVNQLLTGRQRRTTVYLAAGGLLGYAAYMFTGALRGRRLRGEPA
ncbi:signal peptidase [Nocardioides thalensis]|uniref:Signal peptidase I n=1 Tax=Nocardioides thalensis TaxID=1914755 RepID=A0A853C4I7_9ACTN|nr:signal peptidase I [Nocardioides thalensis]NYJ01602.1 signal peptidase [Nocardioides thalensis]